MFETAPPEWERTTLGEVVDQGGGSIQTGPFGSQLHASDYVPVGVPSIMPVNIGVNRLIRDGIACITSEDAQRLSKHIVHKGDIIYSRRGDVERRALVRESEDGWFCGTGCLKVRLGDGVILPEFASYFLGHPEIRAWIVRHAVGATMPNLNTGIMQSVPFLLPPLDQQRAIASILGCLDDKIELNQRMNRTLEQMAAAIFKAWFVDFEPVRAKASGAVSFPCMPQEAFDALPSGFVDSELGPIPEGWAAGCIGDIGDNRRDGIKPDEIDPETPYIGLEHMPKRCIALDAWDGAGKVTSNKSEFSRGEILFGKLRPYFHKVGIAPIVGVCSTDVLVVKPKADHWSAVLLGHLSSLDFVNYTDACSTGTKMPRTNWKDMARYPIAIPPEPIAAEAARLIEPMVEQILSNIHESRTLAETRDALLPKLLSGEVRVTGLSLTMPETEGAACG